MQAVGFRYTLAWSKLKNVVDTRLFITNIDLEISGKFYKFVDIKVFNFEVYSAVEETQIRETDLMVTTESG